MLRLTRKPGQSLMIGENLELAIESIEDGQLTLRLGPEILVTIVAIEGRQVRLGISAPEQVRILRTELLEEVREANASAAAWQAEDLKTLGIEPRKETPCR